MRNYRPAWRTGFRSDMTDSKAGPRHPQGHGARSKNRIVAASDVRVDTWGPASISRSSTPRRARSRSPCWGVRAASSARRTQACRWSRRYATSTCTSSTATVSGSSGTTAGKSTLLRLLSGIYEPRGCLRVRGRVAPVFDLGVGMDPEISGFENIVIRGMFLGMSQGDAREDR